MADDRLSNQSFESASIDELSRASEQEMDDVNFGIIGFDSTYAVTHYNAFESRNAGLSPQRVVGKHLFEEVAPCMNNFMVAQRFEDEAELDETLPYVLTLRMRPTPVRLRLLKASGRESRFVLVERKGSK